ncbi:MAG: hypothetical protein AAF799_42880 [Myxococcota bacterium]
MTLIATALGAPACDAADDPEVQELVREAELEEEFETVLETHTDPSTVDEDQYEHALDLYVATRSGLASDGSPVNKLQPDPWSDPGPPHARCPDAANIHNVWYLSMDPAMCHGTIVHCAPGWSEIEPSCGCGCERTRPRTVGDLTAD